MFNKSSNNIINTLNNKLIKLITKTIIYGFNPFIY